MKITTLIENRVSKAHLVAEHGLSFFIEHPEANILFDTGQSKNFDLNAKQLGIDIATIDYLIISHGHYDHIGGLSHFIENNHKAKIIVKKESLWIKLKEDKYIGISKHVNVVNPRFQFVDRLTEIVSGVFIIPETELFFPIDTHKSGFYIKKKGQILSDEFSDELFMVLKNEKGISILSSCSHNGITNMVETAKKHFDLPLINIIGGFHIKNAGESVVEHIANYFNQNNIASIYTCHCTGVDNFNRLQHKCSNVFYNETGDTITI